jgi:hypothetical protein
VVWWRYLWVDFGYQCGADRYHLSYSGHTRSEIELLCVFEWRTRFLATLMALVLSKNKGTRLNSNPKSLRVAIIQSNWEQQAATYLASVVDWATVDCLWEDQDTREDLRN